MSHVAHDLHAEFPNDGDILHDLKMSDGHFRTVADRYHDINKEIHRIEAEVEAASDERSEELKKQRLLILDEVAAMIAQAKTA
ncbi:YdcH family protein [Parasphingorhabdus sp.]|uniref:YdcH family protein n=1 Tax=Parasphingorhabdus sp. TaxID=2709688 RepID=UPI0030022836